MHDSTTNCNCAISVETSCYLDDQFISALKRKHYKALKNIQRKHLPLQLEMCG